MYFINIHVNIQTLTNVALFYIDKKLANHPIYRYTTINREVDTHETEMYVAII